MKSILDQKLEKIDSFILLDIPSAWREKTWLRQNAEFLARIYPLDFDIFIAKSGKILNLMYDMEAKDDSIKTIKESVEGALDIATRQASLVKELHKLRSILIAELHQSHKWGKEDDSYASLLTQSISLNQIVFSLVETEQRIQALQEEVDKLKLAHAQTYSSIINKLSTILSIYKDILEKQCAFHNNKIKLADLTLNLFELRSTLKTI